MGEEGKVRGSSRQIVPWVIATLVLTGLAIAIGFLLFGRNGKTQVAEKAKPATTARESVVAVAEQDDRVKGDRLSAATLAVFGRTVGSATRKSDDSTFTESTVKLIKTGFGSILLTESADKQDCHACVGYVGAYYLKEVGGKFEVVARYPEAAQGWGWGQPPQDWQVVEKFTIHPAIYSEGGYTGQGYTTMGGQIVELTPDGPSASTFNLGSDDSGAVGDDREPTTIEGAVARIVKGRSFDVVYRGSCTDTQRYVMRAGKFEPAGRPACQEQLETGL